MTRQSTAFRQVFSASSVLEAAGRAIGEIKAQDKLTWADIGAILGVSEDQAAKYAEGTATMNLVTFGRGKQYWNGRFTGYFDLLCEDSRPARADDREGETSLLKAALAFSVALQDGDFSAEEVRVNRHTLETAREAIDQQLAKLRAVA